MKLSPWRGESVDHARASDGGNGGSLPVKNAVRVDQHFGIGAVGGVVEFDVPPIGVSISASGSYDAVTDPIAKERV